MSGVLRGRRDPILAAYMAPSTGAWGCVCQSPGGERDKEEGLSTVCLPFLGSGQAWHLYPMTSCTPPPQSTQWTLSMQSFQEWGLLPAAPSVCLEAALGYKGLSSNAEGGRHKPQGQETAGHSWLGALRLPECTHQTQQEWPRS